MIGFYDYTVILTYVSFASSIYGMICAMTGHFRWAIFCLALSGLCDMFDGKIARRKKDRTEDEKRFGIQIDSLCDVVCFGVFPIVLCYNLGMRHVLSIALLVFYGLAGAADYFYVNCTSAGICCSTSAAGVFFDCTASSCIGNRNFVYHRF